MTEHEEATIKPLTANDPEAQSADILAGNIEQLKTLFPEAFTEGKIDFEVLRQLLGGTVEEREEKYGLNWHGKRKARQLALTPSTGTLRPCPEESAEWDTTKNLMIEGDNLEVLKLLQKSYSGKVKLIYIDPPYNTGKDFVYPDNFQDNIKNYLELTGQVEGGRKISSNTEASGRFHTDWLNMMYPRLKLARNLLREDGVILISIDYNEVGNLRKICDDIFGEENFLAELIWALSSGPQAGHFTRAHETILAFTRNKDLLPNFPDRSGGTISHGALKKISVANPESEVCFKAGSISFEGDSAVFGKELGGSEKEYITSGRLVFKNGLLAEDVTIRAGWAMKNQLLSWLNGQTTFDSKGQKVNKFYFNSQGILFYDKERGTVHPKTVLQNTVVGNTKTGTDEVSSLLGARVMDFPKPSTLINYLSKVVTSDHDIILDFFAGSGTTGNAIYDLNSDEDALRRFILVQLPEPCASDSEAFKAGYKTIADITKERLRRAAQKIKDENPLFPGDLGFRVFKLDSSNINTWEPDRNDIETTLFNSVEHLKSDRSEADILYELLLKLGLDLCVPIEKRTFAGKEVHSVGGGVLLVCLATHITRDEVEPLAQGIVAWHKELAPAGESTSVFRDSAFADDVAKTNLAAILHQHCLEIIRSL